MVGLDNHIRAFAEEFLENSEYFVVDVVMGSTNRKPKISVFLDSDTIVLVDKCAQTSKFIAAKVEDDLGYEEPYIIEVSSAGLDRPFQLKRQYVKNIGRNVEVVLIEGDKLIGKLESVSDDEIKIIIEKTKKKPSEELVIKNNNIKSTKIKISF